MAEPTCSTTQLSFCSLHYNLNGANRIEYLYITLCCLPYRNAAEIGL